MGALVVTFSVVAFAEPVRLVRVLNIVCGVWLVLATWILDGGTPAWTLFSIVSGLALIALNLRRGSAVDSYGGWQRFIH